MGGGGRGCRGGIRGGSNKEDRPVRCLIPALYIKHNLRHEVASLNFDSYIFIMMIIILIIIITIKRTIKNNQRKKKKTLIIK